MSERFQWRNAWVIVLAAAGAIFFTALIVLRLYYFQLFSVPGGSMIPAVYPGDYFLASKSAYNSALPARGDIVIIHWRGQEYFKRIVGLPGDRIRMSSGVLNLNGKDVALKPAGDVTHTDATGAQHDLTLYRETLPGGRSYTIANELDDGPFDNTDLFTVPPDNYFVLGDNRDDSNDSRAGMGYIPRSTIEGRVWRKCWDGRTNRPTWSSVE